MTRYRVRRGVGLHRHRPPKRWRTAALTVTAALFLSVASLGLISVAGAATDNVTSLTISASTPVYGATNTYSVTLVVPMTDPVPTGTVTVTDAQPITCSATLSNPGSDGVTFVGSCAIPSEETVGTVTASYAGDTNYNPASSSNSVTIGPADQAALTVSSASSVNYNATATTLPLTTSGGSGAGPVTYAFTAGTAGCSVTGTTLTATSGGTCTVTATMAGNTDYNPVSSPVTTITIATIAQAALTVTSTSVNYDATATTLPLITSGGSGAGPVTYAFTAGTAGCSVTGTTLTATSAGTCTVTATKAADTDYNMVSSVATTITVATIGQAALTITSVSGTYDSPLTLAVSGGSDSGAVTYAVTAGTAGCSLTGSVLIATSAGTCTATATMAANTDYNAVSSAATTITIGKINQAPLTIIPTSTTFDTALALGVSGGSDNGTVTYTLDDAGTANCSISSGVLSAPTVGTCAVTATMAGNNNYNAVSSSSTTITIERTAQAPLTITSTSGVVNNPLTLAVSGGSDNGAVTYSIDDAGSAACSISNGALSATSAGTCSVTATMAGNTDYNSVSSPATTITLVKTGQAATISSKGGAQFTALAPGSFTFEFSGTPSPVVTTKGALPAGLTLTNNGNGTETISGFTALLALGKHRLTLAATNGIGSPAKRTLDIVVGFAPVLVTSPTATFTVGRQNSFVVESLAYPADSISESGTLPSGVTFAVNSGTATLSGSPATSSLGVHNFSVVAKNSFGSFKQVFRLVVGEVPAFSSADYVTFPVDVPSVFHVAAGGVSRPTISERGTLPKGLRFIGGRGTATLSGTPVRGTSGSYPITFTAGSGSALSASQSFTLVVGAASSFKSADTTTFTVGDATVFIVAATGSPSPSVTERGTLPAGVRFQGGSGSGILSGTPAKGTKGTYRVTLAASGATQTFTLIVAG